MSETDAPGAGDGYIDSYVAFMDILGFSALTDRADTDPDWRKFLTDVNRRPKRTPHRRAKATPFDGLRDGYSGRVVCAGCVGGRA